MTGEEETVAEMMIYIIKYNTVTSGKKNKYNNQCLQKTFVAHRDLHDDKIYTVMSVKTREK